MNRSTLLRHASAGAALALLTLVPAGAKVTIDGQTTINGPGGAQHATNFGSYDASGADKLVVLVGGGRDRGSPLGIGNVTYGGTPLTEAVMVSSTLTSPQGVAVGVFYLDSPGAAGDIEVSWAGKTWGIRNAITVLELSGAAPGHGPVESSADSASASITTVTPDSIVLAVSKSVPDGDTEVPQAPLTDLNASRHGVGSRDIASPSTSTATFSTGHATAAGAFESAVVATGPQLTSVTSLGGGIFELTLLGEADTGYEFRSSTVLDFDPGILVENMTQGDPGDPGTVGSTNNSVLTTDGSGDATVRMMLGGPKNFVRAQIPPPVPPVVVLDENFDSAVAGSLPADWTTGFEAADTLMNTSWELGEINGGPATGPASAYSGANCVVTNLLSNYGLSSNTWLRTPDIDLSTATGATLTFQQWVDMDDFDNLDRGTVRVLQAGTFTGIGVVETNITGLDPLDWTEFSAELPAAALGQLVVVEFQFVSDDVDILDQSGCYLDDVVVTTPAP